MPSARDAPGRDLIMIFWHLLYDKHGHLRWTMEVSIFLSFIFLLRLGVAASAELSRGYKSYWIRSNWAFNIFEHTTCLSQMPFHHLSLDKHSSFLSKHYNRVFSVRSYIRVQVRTLKSVRYKISNHNFVTHCILHHNRNSEFGKGIWNTYRRHTSWWNL